MTKLTDYKPLQRNPNKGTQRGTGILEQSVRELGAGRSILVDKNGVILAGNHAQEAFVNAGIDEVIEVETDGNQVVVVKRTDLDAESSAGKKMAIMDNRTSEQGLAWDAIVVEDLLNEIKDDEGELDAYLESLAKDTGAVIGDPPAEDQGTQIDKAEELRVKWGVELGQLWQLGEHRLICGDCTDKVVVDKVMQGERADMVFTDPPYNVASESRNYAADKSKAMKDLSNAEWDKNFDINSLFPALESIMSADCAVYLCTSHWLVQRVWEWMWSWSDFCSYCVWCKPNPMPSLSKRHWTWATELIPYAVRGHHISNFPDGNHALNWWNIAKQKDTNHPTEKVIGVPEMAIAFSSNDGQIVFDGFLGSGTTLIACERLGRKCRAVEISPAYVAVAIQRWVDMTGQEPVLLTP